MKAENSLIAYVGWRFLSVINTPHFPAVLSGSYIWNTR
jgi:hypothetical protein